MSSRPQQIGFSQRIQLAWFEHAAQAYLAGEDRESISKGLQSILRDKVSVGGTAKRGNRERIITILLKCWVNVPRHTRGLRDRALHLLRALPDEKHIALHWGMCAAVYPFWATVADAAGRLLLLQGEVSAAQVQRRVRELLGERDTVARATRRLIRTFVDWHVIQDTPRLGVYIQSRAQNVDSPELAGWLLEAGLISTGGTPIPASAASHWPMFFPFRMATSIADAAGRAQSLDLIHQQGTDALIALERGPRGC